MRLNQRERRYAAWSPVTCAGFVNRATWEMRREIFESTGRPHLVDLDNPKVRFEVEYDEKTDENVIRVWEVS